MTTYQIPSTFHLAEWADRFRTEAARNKVAYGGRGSGKSRNVANALVLIAATRTVRIVCAREFQASLEQSSKRAIEGAIHEAGLTEHFDIQNNKITCTTTGSEFIFVGFERSRESMRSWEDIDIVWIEEAHRMSPETHRILYPSVRKPGSELWFTFNPEYRSDPVWQDFCSAHPRSNSMIVKVNFDSNPWLPEELDFERRECLERTPELYNHIWLGEPLDDGAVRKVLPFALLQACVDAYDMYVPIVNQATRRHAGLDVADTGGDKNACVVRAGPVIVDVQDWIAKDTWETAQNAHDMMYQNNATRLHYDATGVGSGIRPFLRRTERNYAARPENFGSKVKGEKVMFSRNVTNAEMFSRRNAQLAWAVRMRAENTKRMMNGGDVKPDECLFINPEMEGLETYMLQLSQPEWKENSSGRIVIDKQPDDAPSPDKYDATILAFARDSLYGLTLRQSRNPNVDDRDDDEC